MTPWRDGYIDVDGIRTHYLEAGRGRPVVLLHAGEFGGSAELSWEYTIPALAASYRVLAPDWLGFGLTDKVHDFNGGQNRRILHMRRFLEEMRVGPAAYIGNSMGGLLLARSQAVAVPEWPADAIVLVSSGGFAPLNEARATLLGYDCTRDSMRAMLRVLFHDPGFANDDDYVERRYKWSVVPGAWECAAAARLRSPVSEARGDFGVPDPTEYELIGVPTLVIGGADDALKEPGFSSEIAARIGGAQHILYANCGHAPNIEVAEQFNQDVLKFLSVKYCAG